MLNMEQLGNFPTCFGEKAHQEAGGSGIRLRGKLEDSKQVHVFQSPGHPREGDWTLAPHMVLTCRTAHGGKEFGHMWSTVLENVWTPSHSWLCNTCK